MRAVRSLDGGTHASTHLLETAGPERHVVLRRFPPGDDAAAREEKVLTALDGLGGFAPRLIGVDPHGEQCGAPAVLTTRLPGQADITPADPHAAAAALGRALAGLHAVPRMRLGGFRDGISATRRGTGPAAAALDGHAGRLAAQPRVLSHFDYWSGNVLWRDGVLTGVIDWSGASLAPRGFDAGWCRLDLALLHGPGTTTADTFLAAYRDASGAPPPDMALWDLYTLGRSHSTVETWVPNYASLGRADLTARELRRRHTAWTERTLGAVRT
ncbi:phosphotransferase family protein [Streptomyces winkii]|uniref:phosphotransferase family protein n=1 Tax=Streptomyces winkii TaxID=3051178 RepID=UPI0028D72A5F|nr:phosphotransferase [Streptomyces sp. DSM 40971]